MSSSDRRTASRHRVSLTVELHHGRSQVLLQTFDLSAGGAFFDHAIPYPVGTKVRVRLDLPGDPIPVFCEGLVVSRRAGELGMGLQFLELLDEDRARLVAFAAQVAPGPTEL